MRRTYLFAILALAFGLLCGSAQAEFLRLPAVISDNMVLQQDIANCIWGWAQPGAMVSVTISGQTVRTTADAKTGKWMLKLKALKPTNSTLSMTVSSNGEQKVINNILVGEVWVCSGQSNMEWTASKIQDSVNVIAQANYPQIRHFYTPQVALTEPAEDCKGQWVVCSPDTVGGFTAVGYMFALNLHKTLGRPVGLINSSWGGTPIESWTSRDAMQAEPEFAPYLKTFSDVMAAYPEMKKKYDREVEANKAFNGWSQPDTGWESLELNESDWKEISQPAQWEYNGLNMDGVVWQRKTIDVPQSWAGKDLTLNLATIDDNDVTYWNGVKVGENMDYSKVRKYIVPASLVKAGKAVIAIKITDTGGGGGIIGEAKDTTLVCVGQDPISLSGKWKYKVASIFRMTVDTPMGPGNPQLPTSLYNGQIAPIVPFGIRGAIWYQGCANSGDAPDSYFYKMRGMINGWRKVWGVGDFPFLYVQLANFQGVTTDPSDGGWGTVRQSQLRALSLKNTGMAVAIDLADAGNPFDIHPKDKQDVGYRLALWALAKTYGKKNLVCSGPVYKSMKIEGDKIRISFDYTGGGLIVGSKEGIAPFAELKGAKLERFAIAGADKKWYWADAVIDGKTVLVSSPNVPNPVNVRYAYSTNPEGAKLYNKEGLPAAPFTTNSKW